MAESETKKKRSDSRQRTRQIHLRLLREEYACLRKSARAAGRSPGDHIRDLIMAEELHAKRPFSAPLYRSFYAFANHFNQLVRKVHGGARPTAGELDRLSQLAADIRMARRAPPCDNRVGPESAPDE